MPTPRPPKRDSLSKIRKTPIENITTCVPLLRGLKGQGAAVTRDGGGESPRKWCPSSTSAPQVKKRAGDSHSVTQLKYFLSQLQILKFFCARTSEGTPPAHPVHHPQDHKVLGLFPKVRISDKQTFETPFVKIPGAFFCGPGESEQSEASHEGTAAACVHNAHEAVPSTGKGASSGEVQLAVCDAYRVRNAAAGVPCPGWRAADGASTDANTVGEGQHAHGIADGDLGGGDQ